MHDMTNFLTLFSLTYRHIRAAKHRSSAYDTWVKPGVEALLTQLSFCPPSAQTYIILVKFHISWSHRQLLWHKIEEWAHQPENSRRTVGAQHWEHWTNCTRLWYKRSHRMCHKSVLFATNRFHIYCNDLIAFELHWLANSRLTINHSSNYGSDELINQMTLWSRGHFSHYSHSSAVMACTTLRPINWDNIKTLKQSMNYFQRFWFKHS